MASPALYPVPFFPRNGCAAKRLTAGGDAVKLMDALAQTLTLISAGGRVHGGQHL